jgi:hypothetical protein
MLAFAATPIFAAAAATPVGSYFIADRGPGAWVGGGLLSDGTATGGGAFSFQVSPGVHETAKVTPTTWTQSGTTVTICFNVVGVVGPVYPIGQVTPVCLPLAVTGAAGHPGSAFGDPRTFYKVILK